MAQEISFDDLIPATKERVAAIPAVSSTAPVTNSNEISFDDLLPTEKQQIVGDRWHNIGRTAVETVPAASAGLVGFGAGMAAAAPVAAIAAPLTGLFAPVTAGVIELAGGLGGAFLASGAAQKITNWMHEAFAPEDYKQRQIEKAQRPYGTFAAQTLTNLAGMSPKTIPEVATKILTKPLVQRGASAGFSGAIEAGAELATEGKIDPIKVAASTAAGAVMPGFNPAGAKLFGAGQAAAKMILPKKSTIDVNLGKEELPTKPPEGSTPEQKQAYIDKLKTIVLEREAKIPLVETAIRNKETGEIELMGPKHNEQRKLETIDTHDQGFITEDNRFLDRKQAFEQAKRSGQIPEGQNPTDLSIGLRSEDLRIAGDGRFKLPEIPNVVEGIPTFKTDKIVRTDTGEKIGAKTRRDSSTGAPLRIDVDVDFLYQQFNDKPWTKPKVEGVFPIAENAFKTPQEWIDFVIQHEAEHVKTPKVEGQTKAQYENQTNKAALETLNKDKVSAPSKVIGSPDELLVVDRTKTNPRDVKNEQEFNDIATEIYQKHGEVEAVKFFEGYQEYKKTFLEPINETEKFVGINLRNKVANERIIHNESVDMKDLVPDLSRREAIAIAVDRGDLSGLSPIELLVAKNYSELVKNIGDEAVNKGVVKGLIEDYVTHIVNWSDAPKGFKEEFLTMLLGTSKNDPTMRGMTTESKFAKERTFKTFENLEVYLEQANQRLEASGSTFRLQLKTKDIAEIYKEYALSMQKAIENKSLVDNLKQIRNVNGVSLIQEITKENPLPQGWIMMDSPQFAGYAVHPDLLPALKFVFDAGPGQLMGALGAISQVTKRLNVVGSFFHAKSLMEVLSSTGIPIWTPLKEAVVLPLVEKTVKGLTGKELELSAITKAVNQYRKGGAGDNVDKWIKEGRLQLESPEDVSKGVLTAAGKFADEIIGKYGPKTRVLEKSLSTVEKYTLGIFDKYTWDYLHTGGKLMVADAFLDKARLNAAKEGKVFDEVASRREISSFVDSSFGGLNWFEIATQTRTKLGKDIAMATYSPAGRRALQIGLFAPDWTISTIRAFTMALPKGFNPTKWHPVEGIKGMRTPTTKQDYARLYQFKTALTYLTLLNGINMIVANRPIWENKDKSRIEFPDGTSMQAMKHAMEPYHWITDPDKTLSNKLGFIPKAAIIGVAGTEYASPQAPKIVPPNVTGISSVDSALGRAKAIGSMALPFQVQAAATAPPGEGVKRAVLGTMGLPVYGGTAEQKKTARAEREKILKENAARYRQKEKEAGR